MKVVYQYGVDSINSHVDIVLYGSRFEEGISCSRYHKEYEKLLGSGLLDGKVFHLSFVDNLLKGVIFIPFEKGMPMDLWRKNVSEATRLCLEYKYEKLDIYFQGFAGEVDVLGDYARVLSEIIILSAYRYDLLKSNWNHDAELTVNILLDQVHSEELRHSFKEGIILGESTAIVRDLVNTPSNKQSPIQFAKEVENLFRDTKAKVTVLGKAEIEGLGMKGFLKVSQGSENPPVLIKIEYRTDLSKPLGALVGKGITYDSGGLSLKSKDRMITMHHDMAGAAAVVGAVYAMNEQQIQQNVIAVLPVCENLIATDGYRPGDIIEMMNGNTVLIKSTDAEGRLVLADAIYYAINHEQVDEIIDIASLTGGARMAFGPVASAYAIDRHSDKAQKRLLQASEKAGEKIWEMPLFDEYQEMLESEHADISNTGEGSKMIGGALFIKHFIPCMPWIHLDIAGTCWSSKNKHFYSYGATGVGCRLLYHFLKNQE